MPPVKMRGTAKPKDIKKTLVRIISYMASYKFLWFVVFICVLISSLSDVISAYAIKPVINNYIVPLIGKDKIDLSLFVQMLIKLSLVLLLGSFCTWANNRIVLQISSDLLCRIRKDLFERLQALPMKYYDEHSHGDIMSRFTNDTDTLRDMFSQTVPQLMSSTITILGVFIMMCVLSPVLTLVVVVTISLMMVLAKWFGSLSIKFFKENQKNMGDLNGYIEELIQGQKVVKVFNYQERSQMCFDSLNEELRKSGSKANFIAGGMGPVMGNLSHLQYAFLTFTGAMLIVFSKMDIGTFASFLQYAKTFSRPVTMIGQLFNNVLNALAGAERIFATIDESKEIDEGYYTLVNCWTKENKIMESFARTNEWAWKNIRDSSYIPLKGDIKLKNVSFGYREDKEILHKINIDAHRGQKIALVGSTGSGKTTIVNLLSRFYDTSSGSITIDGIEIKKIKKDSLRRAFGEVLQDTHLFTGTIRDNIKFGYLGASKKEIEEACDRVKASYFISNCKDGYDTMLEGDDSGLSQGEKQLLSIARAFVSNSPFLILDEATSSIDTRTEGIIQESMKVLMEGRTVFIIAHRLSTVRNADVILVLDHGTIIEEGNHESLMNAKGAYYSLYTGRRVNS